METSALIRAAVQKLIDRYLEGNADAGEEQLMNNWLDILASEAPAAEKRLSAKERERLRRELLAAIRRKTGEQQKVRRMLLQRSGIAAAILSLLFAGYLLLRLLSSPAAPAFTVVRTGIGEKKLMTLPDSTRIWLAPNSELQYPDNYSATRKVQLLSGEAFFEVRQNAQRHFTVQADSLQVEVLGTSFNIRAYHDLPDRLIGVSSGKIKVSQQQRALGTLSAGEQLRIGHSRGDIGRSHISINAIDGWVHNRIVFEQAPLQEVLSMLQHYYPVSFSLQQQRSLLISGSLDSRLRIEQVIAVLEEFSNHDIAFRKQNTGHYIVQ